VTSNIFRHPVVVAKMTCDMPTADDSRARIDAIRPEFARREIVGLPGLAIRLALLEFSQGRLGWAWNLDEELRVDAPAG
jgi:hypothetical protein